MSTNRLSTETQVDLLALQDSWFNIYRGKPAWLEQWYQGLEGIRKKRTRLKLNAGKVSSNELANLLFSEAPQINTDDAVLEILKNNKFLKNSKNLSEYIAALGGGAYKLRSDGEKVIIDYVKAYNIIPISWDNSQVFEADFLSDKVIKGETYKIVEKHRKVYKNLPLMDDEGKMILNKGLPVLGDETLFTGYSIKTEMYKNEQKVPLPFDMIELQEINVFRPLFSYIKTSLANNFNPDSPIGISYFANATDTIKALDMAFDCLYGEMELGQKRIIVPAEAIRYTIDTTTNKRVRYFDPSDRVFLALKTGDDKLDITDNSVELRTEEIKTAIQVLLDIYCMQVGFSAGHLAFDSGGMKTATEVISNNSKTFKTKTAFENEMAEGMVDIMDAIRALITLNGVSVSGDEYSVTFDDSVIEDRNSKKDYWADMVASGFVTKKMAIMKLWNIDEIAAQKMLDEIEKEQPEPIKNFGF
jgi:A118 family predicted phage portal protein